MRKGVRFALDLGTNRIGVAKCDASAILASPYAVWSPNDLIKNMAEALAEWTPIEVLVGVPIDLRGNAGIAAEAVQQIADELQRAFPQTTFRMVDERLTTIVARGQLQSSGYTTRTDKSLIDAVAACVLLEDALEYERRNHDAPGEVLK